MSGGRVVPDVLAAVDLGSNSFHMVVARHSHGQLVILDRLREMVRLAGGLSDSGRLDDAATDRALRCLERFGQRLRAMQADSVRVVGTNALRRARRKRWFRAPSSDRYCWLRYTRRQRQSAMNPLFSTEAGRTCKMSGLLCRSQSRQMPRRYLCVLPSRSRPSLFSGD